MDTITHGVAGALIAKALSDSADHHAARRAVVLGAVVPDLDLLGGLFFQDSIRELEFHRGITHSLVALPVLALLLGLLTLRRRPGWKLLAACYGIGLASHILLDVITAYGTMIFQPLSMARYTTDMVFIIDLTLGSLVLVPQLVAWAWSDSAVAAKRVWVGWLFTLAGAVAAFLLVNAAGVRLSASSILVAVCLFAAAFAIPGLTSIGGQWPRSRYCRVALCLCAAYLLSCAVAHRLAEQRVREVVARYNIQATKLAALPAPPSLLQWVGLAQTEDGITRIPITLTDHSEPNVERYIHSAPLPNPDKLQALPALQTFLWFARFPWVTTRDSSDGPVVEYRDIQFLRPSPRGDPPFTFRVQFDHLGNLIAAGLSSR